MTPSAEPDAVADWQLRAMRAGDLDAVMSLEPVLFGRGQWSRSTYEAELLFPSRAYVVATGSAPGYGAEGELLGYAGIDLSPEASVMTVGVAPAHQRRGIGRALMAYLLDQARGENCRQVHLEVRDTDTGAQRLYTSFGFEVIGRRRRYYHDADGLTMRLRLRNPAGPVG